MNELGTTRRYYLEWKAGNNTWYKRSNSICTSPTEAFDMVTEARRNTGSDIKWRVIEEVVTRQVVEEQQ